MGKRTRYACNVLANWIEDAAERAVAWLRLKGERPRRVRPLSFPSPLWVQMMELNDKWLRLMVPIIAKDILRDIPYITKPGSPIKIRMPSDG